MRRLAVALAAALAAGCRKGPPPREAPSVPARAVVAGVPLVDYEAPTGEFACRAPADWRALEDESMGPRVMFFGPGGSVAISILRYPDGGRIKTPEEYAGSLKLSGRDPGPLETRAAGGRTEYRLHYESARRPPRGRKAPRAKREDVALVPVRGGFFAITHSAPVETYAATMPVFEAVVASFRPKTP